MESIKKKSRNGKISDNQGEAIFLETEFDQPPINIVDQFSPDELEINTENVRPISKATTPTQTRRSISKIPIRSNSSPRNDRTSSLPPPSNKGAFRFFTSNNELQDQRKRLASSDDEDLHLKEDDLKQKLKEEKRQGKKNGELLTKLQENYEELLEKYAQAENTIDQLRFQPKIFGDNTPKASTSEHFIHLTQQSKVNITALRSSGAYGSPLSSIRPVPSSITTPARKSISPTNSGTIESIFFDEISSETLKVDLLFETKSLGDKMKSFLVLMDENQLSLAEQKQVYEQIKQDYEKLIKEFDQNKRDIDLDTDLNKELEIMKQLLKDIVKKLTQNLLGKSMIESSIERLTNDTSHSSQLSVRSSICNHNDLMDQYQKLLNAVNTTKPSPIKSITNDLQPKLNQSERQQSIKNKQKAYVYVSADSDDEQQESDSVTPIPYTKGVQSTSFGLDYIPSTSVKHHQHPIEEQRSENLQSKRKPLPPPEITTRTNDYDSGIGTNNLTKLSFDSKLYTSTMDESHFQSLDDGQESISSRSSGSGSASPGSPYSKKFDKQSIYRRKPSGHLNSHTETQITGSFDLPSESYKKKNMHRSFHTWRPQKNSTSHRSRLTPIHRSVSITTPSIEDYKIRSLRSLPNPEISSKIKNNPRPLSSYKSSIYINHTNNKSPEKLDRNLYLDPQTGTVYRYETEKNSNPPRIYYEPSPSKKLYRCLECGSVTTYHHRHHINHVTTNSDDLGYESGHQRRHRRYRYVDYVSSSSSSSEDSDSDVNPTYLEMIALNQAYKRAENIRYQSQCLSRYIVRQLKLALATL